MTKELVAEEPWQKVLRQQIAAGRWTSEGLFGILDHCGLAQRVGERLSREQARAERELEAWLAGRLVARPDWVLARPNVRDEEGVRWVDLKPNIDALIASGIHKHSVGPSGKKGMSEAEFRACWPDKVAYPSLHYKFMYPYVLLVDLTVDLRRVFPGDFWYGITPRPEILDLGYRSQKRVVIFFGYEGNLGRRFWDCHLEESASHIPLTFEEGLWLHLQHGCMLQAKSHLVACTGSVMSEDGNYDMQFGHAPGFGAFRGSGDQESRRLYVNMTISSSKRSDTQGPHIAPVFRGCYVYVE